MSAVQRFFKAVFPRAWAEDMEAQSKAWKLRCPCGHVRSFWDIGGIRWKAAGRPRKWLRCPACGTRRWHECYYEAQPIGGAG
jgi:hypothetical protein